uniref:Uncharacterized protein n=1 Tax=Rhizophora mucronata TaxID=61149 RepID=A0A2P2QJ96_RHIMU
MIYPKYLQEHSRYILNVIPSKIL